MMGLGSPLGQKGPRRCFVRGSDPGCLSKEKSPVRVHGHHSSSVCVCVCVCDLFEMVLITTLLQIMTAAEALSNCGLDVMNL